MVNNFKHIILYFLIGFSFFSCKHEKINHKFIDKLSSVKNDLPSPYFNYYLYFKLDDGSLLETNIDFIYQFYQDKQISGDKDFYSYLNDLFNRTEIITIRDVKKYDNQKYILNISKIDKNTEELEVKDVKKQYLKSEQDTFILSASKFDPHIVKTILYKMFINGYIINLNDYGGYYIIRTYNQSAL